LFFFSGFFGLIGFSIFLLTLTLYVHQIWLLMNQNNHQTTLYPRVWPVHSEWQHSCPDTSLKWTVKPRKLSILIMVVTTASGSLLLRPSLSSATILIVCRMWIIHVLQIIHLYGGPDLIWPNSNGWAWSGPPPKRKKHIGLGRPRLAGLPQPIYLL